MRPLVGDVLEQWRGGATGEQLETDRVDCKVDPASVDRHGNSVVSPPRQELRTAWHLAAFAACMANSGGGVLIVGIDDKAGTLVPTGVDIRWLRGRIHAFTQPHLDVTIEEWEEQQGRLVVVLVPGARGSPIRGPDHRQPPGSKTYRTLHRVDRACVELTFDAWRDRMSTTPVGDWSGERSSVDRSGVTDGAPEALRSLARRQARDDLAGMPDMELIRTLGLATDDDFLTRAGALLLTTSWDGPVIDFRRRDREGGATVDRWDSPESSGIEAIEVVFGRLEAHNRQYQLQRSGAAVAQFRAIHPRVAREAVVNAIMHRDYLQPGPVVAEFAGDVLTVTSPGTLLPEVAGRLLVSSRSRNRTLVAALRRLRLAEDEGAGVDLMYREMLVVGHEPPVIVDDGHEVRCRLEGGPPDPRMRNLVELLESTPTLRDLLVIALGSRHPHVTVSRFAEAAEIPIKEARAVLPGVVADLRITWADAAVPVLERAAVSRLSNDPVYHLGDEAREVLGGRVSWLDPDTMAARDRVVQFAQMHGQVARRDVQELTGWRDSRATSILGDLSDGPAPRLRLGSKSSRGRNVHYIPVEDGPRDDGTTM